MGSTDDTCELCFGVVWDPDTRTIVKPANFLWSYLYHKNVREALLPSTVDSDPSTTQQQIPKLSFTFSLGGTPTSTSCENSGDTDHVSICETCLGEVNQLENLHQQLESCKKMITAQVERIERVCEAPDVRRNRAMESLWRKGVAQFRSDVALAGTSVGSDNISQVLRCLESLCGGINTSSGDPVPPALARPTGTTNAAVKIDTDDRVDVRESDVNVVEEPRNVLEGSVPESIQGTYQDFNSIQHPGDSVVEEDVGDLFLYPVPVNIDPEPIDNFIELKPSSNDIDLLNYNTQSGGINNDPLADEDDQTPSTSTASLFIKPQVVSTFPLTMLEQSNIPPLINTKVKKSGFSRKPVTRFPRKAKANNDSPAKEGGQSQNTLMTSLPVSALPLTLPDQSNIKPLINAEVKKSRFSKKPRTKFSKDAKRPCQLCGKLLSADLLYRHMRRHTGQLKYRCEFCGKTFHCNFHLVDHRRVHTGEKPFSCEMCQLSFTQSCNLKRHVKKVHGNNKKIRNEKTFK